MFDLQFFSALLTIFVINIVLSGDNAVVIALASRKLPAKQQKKAIFWGTFGAIVLRVILTFVAVSLLKTVPFLHLVGGLLLIWIAYKLLNDEENGENIRAANGLGKAIQTVIVADLVMSLDNVLAVAAVAQNSFLLILIGIGTSIPLIIWGSSILIKLMGRFPIIIWIGAGLLAWTAGDMINKDKRINEYILYIFDSIEWVVPVMIVAGVLGMSFIRRRNIQHPQS